MPNDSTRPHGYFTAPVTETDPVIAAAIAHELARQQDVIELIASEKHRQPRRARRYQRRWAESCQ